MTRRPPGRVLVVSSATHGHRSFAAALAAALERRDVDYDHIEIRRALWNRAFGYTIQRARGADLEALRRQVALDVQLAALAQHAMSTYDVVHVVPSGFAHAFARRRPGARAALSVGMDCTAELMRDEYASNPLQESLRHRVDRVTFERADHVACYSEWARRSVLDNYRRPVDLTEVVAPAAPVPGARSPRPSRARPVIGFVGRPWHRKGGDRLVRWLQDGRLGDAELHILCGDVPANARAIPGVQVHEPMPRDEVLDSFLPSCDLFVLPTWRDQSPWVLAEAAAAGLATVASSMGGIHELVMDGVTGLLVAPDDDDGFCSAIARLVDDAGLRERMGQAAHVHAAVHFDETVNFDRLADRLVQLG